MAEEQALVDAGHHDGGVEEIVGVPPQLTVTPGMPERDAVRRRQERVRQILHTLPPAAQEAIRDDLDGRGQLAELVPVARHRPVGDDAPTVHLGATSGGVPHG